MADDDSHPVECWAYDLAQGQAAGLSQMFLGSSGITAIWHTSVVVHNTEYWFSGQGIQSSRPGGSPHGQPLERHSLGATSIDPATLAELLADLSTSFPGSSYHLLRHNCNHFSQELAQILTGASIPSHIRDLPATFLESPLGQMLAPSIDAMFGAGAASSSAPARGAPAPALGMLDRVAAQGIGVPGTSNGFAAVTHLNTPADLDRLLASAPCTAVLFTSATCPPCRIIDPVFTSLAEEHAPASTSTSRATRRRIAFGKVESGPASSSLMGSRKVTATPTMQFFVHGKQRAEIKGADVAELKSQVELTLFEVYKVHPHTLLRTPLRSLRDVPRHPIKSTAVPNLRAATVKLDEVISANPAKSISGMADVQDARRLVVSRIVPWLERRFAPNGEKTSKPLDRETMLGWAKSLQVLNGALPVTALFPLVDMLRLAVLDDATAASLSVDKVPGESSTIIHSLLAHVARAVKEDVNDAKARPVLLTSLRLLGNALAVPTLGDALLLDASARSDVTALLVETTLASDATIRTVAASATFNAVLHAAKERPNWVRADGNVEEGTEGLGSEWESEILSALLESIKAEGKSIETLHRLVAALLLLLHASPHHTELTELARALEAPSSLSAKADEALVKACADDRVKASVSALLADCRTLCQA